MVFKNLHYIHETSVSPQHMPAEERKSLKHREKGVVFPRVGDIPAFFITRC